MKLLKLAAVVFIAFGFALIQSPGRADAAGDARRAVFLDGLKQKVTVRRDARSIPYIEARNEADLYFAQGFETARDRLWQMDLYRRVARGRLAEIFGKRVVPQDKRWRRYGFSGVAEKSLRVLDPGLRSALEAYASGVNAYIATLDAKTLPIEFRNLRYEPEQWKPTDSLVIGKILADALSSTWNLDLYRYSLRNLAPEKLRDLYKPVSEYDVVLFGKDVPEKEGSLRDRLNGIPDGELAVVYRKAGKMGKIREASLKLTGFFAEGLAASNNWVISGKRTLDGKAILANDPHLRPSAPGIWYLTHLSAPGLKVSGVTFPGVPGIVLGHNASIAWGATNVGPDVQDIYFEEFNDKGEYKTASGWKKPVRRIEKILVRKSPGSKETETVEFEVLETGNGVIITETAGRKIALKWTARMPENQEFEAFFHLNRAKNWSDFKKALANYGGATQNFVYADTEGNIGWYAAGKIPLRRKGTGALPYEGPSNDGDWLGYIPFRELPHLYNPESGFIATANQRIVGYGYKYQQISRQTAPPWRARRIYELLAANDKITMNDVSDIQRDLFNIPLSLFAREVIRRGAASSETLTLLKGWDGRVSADSRAAVVVNEMRLCTGDEIARAHKPVRGSHFREFVLERALRTDSKLWLPSKYKDYGEIFKSCEGTALERISKNRRLGSKPSEQTWGRYRQAVFSHPLAAVPFLGARYRVRFTNVGGSSQTPNVGAYVSMRHIAKPADWDKTRHVIPLGESGDPASRHWKDQFESWRTGMPISFPFTQGAVAKASVSSLELRPRGANSASPGR